MSVFLSIPVLLGVLGAQTRDGGRGLLDGLMFPRAGERNRLSSFDRTGGNTDRWRIPAGETVLLGEIEGPAVIRHIWITVRADSPDYLDALWFRISWDGESKPSVEVPLGEFFCLGHGTVEDVFALPICVNKAPHVPAPPGQAAFNCYFPMPFLKTADITVENRAETDLDAFYFYIDYETSPGLDPEVRYFHAAYREEETVPDDDTSTNTSGEGNYVILEATGSGHYVGCSMSVDSRPGDPGKWWEGDDMIWIDDEAWPPALHGTGTEDYFNSAWGIRRAFCTPFYGVSVFQKGLYPDERYYNGRFTCYRFHVLDPVGFRKSIRVSIEHGHGNDAGNRYSSVAYWYMR